MAMSSVCKEDGIAVVPCVSCVCICVGVRACGLSWACLCAMYREGGAFTCKIFLICWCPCSHSLLTVSLCPQPPAEVAGEGEC